MKNTDATPFHRQAHWLALARIPQLTSTELRALLSRWPDPEAILDADLDQLAEAGVSKETWNYLRKKGLSVVAKDVEWLQQPGHHLLTLTDADYPSHLREIPDPPPLLFVRGDPAILAYPQIAMVGSRNPTPMGREIASAFAKELAEMGFVITSGLAIGIDGAAHRGTLSVGGPTIAVVGTGLDRIYPARHRELGLEIIKTGACVSEFFLGTPPLAVNFPQRNRIISGLSLGVLVVEATTRSGSLITARLAGEQGREVFAIPGSIHNPLARGCHMLLRQGAKLVESASDVIEELGPQEFTVVSRQIIDNKSERDSSTQGLTSSTSPSQVPGKKSTAANPAVDGINREFDLDTEYRILLDNLGFEQTPIDVLVERTGWTVEVLSSMLLTLELRGFVSSIPGGGYTRSVS